MKSKQTQDVMLEALESFATTIQSKFGAVVDGREEDQLRRPVDELLEKIGRSQNLNVVAKDESTLDDKLGRPDFAVTVRGFFLSFVATIRSVTDACVISGQQAWRAFLRQRCHHEECGEDRQSFASDGFHVR